MKNGESLHLSCEGHLVDTRWTQGGRKGDIGGHEVDVGGRRGT